LHSHTVALALAGATLARARPAITANAATPAIIRRGRLSTGVERFVIATASIPLLADVSASLLHETRAASCLD